MALLIRFVNTTLHACFFTVISKVIISKVFISIVVVSFLHAAFKNKLAYLLNVILEPFLYRILHQPILEWSTLDYTLALPSNIRPGWKILPSKTL